jgi:hypothetical protein
LIFFEFTILQHGSQSRREIHSTHFLPQCPLFVQKSNNRKPVQAPAPTPIAAPIPVKAPTPTSVAAPIPKASSVPIVDTTPYHITTWDSQSLW